MRRRVASARVNLRAPVQFAALSASVAVALPISYLATSGSCAALASCYLRGTACLAVCVNPLSQVSAFLWLGFLIGLLPAGAAAFAYWRVRPGNGILSPLWIGLASLLLALPGLVVLFDVSGIEFGLLALPLAAGLAILINRASAREGPAPPAD